MPLSCIIDGLCWFGPIHLSIQELTTRPGDRRLQTWAEANQLPDLERNVKLKRR